MEHVSKMWGNLSKQQLKEFAIILDYAEHHAMREYAASDEIPWRNKWSYKIKELAAMQVEIRGMVENFTNHYTPYPPNVA